MKALSVHGGGAEFASTSCNVGRRGQYGPEGIATLSGLDGRKSLEDIKPSSSASQSERTEEQYVVCLDVDRYSVGGFCFLDLLIALRRYLMDTVLPIHLFDLVFSRTVTRLWILIKVCRGCYCIEYIDCGK